MSDPREVEDAPFRSAAWLALLAGLLEVLLVWYRKYHDGEFTARSRDMLWLAPLAYLLLYSAGAVAVAGAGRLWAGLPRQAVIVFGGVAGLVASALLVHFGPRLHPVALVLVSLGAGFQASRVTEARRAGVARLVGRTLPVMLAALLLAAATSIGGRWWRERRAAATLPAAHPGAPNVLLLVLDTVRAASLSLYGHARPTAPELERLGAAGTVFDRALSTAPWTLPSHASMFTGRWPHELTTSWFRPLDRADTTLAEALARRGYRTGGFVANLIYTDYEKGLGRGFQRYQDFPFSLATLLRSCALTRKLSDTRALRWILGTDQILGRKHADAVNAEFLDWQAGLGGRPFFAFLNYFDAHDPYLPPHDWFRRIAGYERHGDLSPLRRLAITQRREQMRPEDVLLERDAYEASIAWLDDEIRQLLETLAARGVLEHTIVIITSDHGEEFGEHGIYLHGHTLFREAVHVPLVIWAPGRVPAARRVTRPVSLRDLPATVMALATGEDGRPFPGAPLTRFLGDTLPPPEAPVLSEVQQAVRMPDWYPAAHGSLRALTDSAYHFIQHADSSHQLFGWEDDPEERHNLYDTAEGRARAAGYLALLQEVGAFRPTWQKVEFP